ncbi:gamma-glutamylcyclotransferase [Telmatobacter bradus]|uniref:gamma-glutamylcyclotransferase n=1 Tax=Telmatobacter bradus TaxID=474953 RepID=UPI003B427CC3
MSDEEWAENRLAVYGSLAPGQENHDQLVALRGVWRQGTVHGSVFPLTWGEAAGYLALVLDAAGPEVAVQVFESPDLPVHWARLDAFEGSSYWRVRTKVQTEEGLIDASIYVLAE